jgi:hypothetical protein
MVIQLQCKAELKYPTDLYDNIYIDNIQKAVVICLIIPTTFPFDAGSSVTSEKCIIRQPSWVDVGTVGHLERGSTQRGLYLICCSSFKREEL